MRWVIVWQPGGRYDLCESLPETPDDQYMVRAGNLGYHEAKLLMRELNRKNEN